MKATVPDDTDRRIFAMTQLGRSWPDIGRELHISAASAEARVVRCQARRWATASGQLLTSAERERLIRFEFAAFHRTEKQPA